MGLEVTLAADVVTVLNIGDEYGPTPPPGGPALNFSIASNSMYVPVMGF